jgi:sugar O-acyltransferase (sialic acid O-acetyltransferase NeuD family)
MSNDVLVIGAGGHASVLIEILIDQDVNIIGYVSPLPAVNQKIFSDLHWFKCDDDILKFDKSTIKLVNGIGSLPGNTLRADFYSKYKKIGYRFGSVISQDASISKYAKLAEGVQVMCGAIVQTGVSVGCNSIINTGAIIDHDASIGSNNHIAPGVTISGQVTSKENVHFGTGCSVIQLININENAVIGAGATITKNIESNAVCYPAHIFKKIME